MKTVNRQQKTNTPEKKAPVFGRPLVPYFLDDHEKGGESLDGSEPQINEDLVLSEAAIEMQQKLLVPKGDNSIIVREFKDGYFENRVIPLSAVLEKQYQRPQIEEVRYSHGMNRKRDQETFSSLATVNGNHHQRRHANGAVINGFKVSANGKSDNRSSPIRSERKGSKQKKADRPHQLSLDQHAITQPLRQVAAQPDLPSSEQTDRNPQLQTPPPPPLPHQQMQQQGGFHIQQHQLPLSSPLPSPLPPPPQHFLFHPPPHYHIPLPPHHLQFPPHPMYPPHPLMSPPHQMYPIPPPLGPMSPQQGHLPIAPQQPNQEKEPEAEPEDPNPKLEFESPELEPVPDTGHHLDSSSWSQKDDTSPLRPTWLSPQPRQPRSNTLRSSLSSQPNRRRGSLSRSARSMPRNPKLILYYGDDHNESDEDDYDDITRFDNRRGRQPATAGSWKPAFYGTNRQQQSPPRSVLRTIKPTPIRPYQQPMDGLAIQKQRQEENVIGSLFSKLSLSGQQHSNYRSPSPDAFDVSVPDSDGDSSFEQTHPETPVFKTPPRPRRSSQPKKLPKGPSDITLPKVQSEEELLRSLQLGEKIKKTHTSVAEERFAGGSWSSSPPPTSLPLPKFGRK